MRYPSTGGLPIAYFGRDTGAAAVLVAVAEHPDVLREATCAAMFAAHIRIVDTRLSPGQPRSAT